MDDKDNNYSPLVKYIIKKYADRATPDLSMNDMIEDYYHCLLCLSVYSRLFKNDLKDRIEFLLESEEGCDLKREHEDMAGFYKEVLEDSLKFKKELRKIINFENQYDRRFN